MATDKQTVSFRAGKQTRDRITAYMESKGYDQQSDAVKELVDVGLREQRSPLVYRMKDRVVDWASWLLMMAVMVLIAGATTAAVPLPGAYKFSVATASVAVGMLGVYELVRFVGGMNEIGAGIRAWVRGVRG